MLLTFYGGAKEVTGANYIITTLKDALMVDCGMFQGSYHCEQQNYEPFPYNPKNINFVLITHSHIDHIGRIPKLVADGFQGKILSTPPTKDLSELAFYDSLSLIQDEADKHNHKPLFTEKDIQKAMNLWQTINYNKQINLSDNFSCQFRDAGHILGSSIIEIWAKEKKHKIKITFTGDLGNPPVPLLNPTELIESTDYLIIESAYGNRLHENRESRKKLLEQTIENTVTNNGVLMIPAFANERTQEILYELNELVENNRIPKIPIFIDSPLAIKATEIYKKYKNFYNPEALNLLRGGDQLFSFPGLKFTLTKEESKSINDVVPPKVIIAGSGMLQGGRILHHLKRYLPDPNSTLLFIGYQVKGSLGRQILDGAKQVKIHKELIEVKANIVEIGGYSAHADQEMLRFFISKINKPIKKIFVVQGEENTTEIFANLIKDRLAIEAIAPSYNESFKL